MSTQRHDATPSQIRNSEAKLEWRTMPKHTNAPHRSTHPLIPYTPLMMPTSPTRRSRRRRLSRSADSLCLLLTILLYVCHIYDLYVQKGLN
uniref:Uncharacterized protein n=1 Tax=Steinernema glaseri TaxID=37863 RepID=A0A1I8AJS8_9BILA